MIQSVNEEITKPYRVAKWLEEWLSELPVHYVIDLYMGRMQMIVIVGLPDAKRAGHVLVNAEKAHFTDSVGLRLPFSELVFWRLMAFSLASTGAEHQYKQTFGSV